jgi:dTMP kinase
MPGRLITFEGIDGCGKTTQIQELIRRLTNRYDYLVVREPGGTAISEKIRAILLDRNHGEMYPITELLLYAASRHQLCQQIIIPALNAGKIVLCDRFYDSTTVYQGYGRGLALSFINELNRIATAGIVPDLTFVFDISLKEREQRMAGRVHDRLEMGDGDFQARVWAGFRQIALAEPDRIRLIDGERSVTEIADEVWQHFLALLKE